MRNKGRGSRERVTDTVFFCQQRGKAPWSQGLLQCEVEGKAHMFLVVCPLSVFPDSLCLLISVPGVLGSLFSVESSKSFLPCLLLSAPVFPFSPYSVFVWCYLSALVSALSMTSGSLPFSLLILHYVHTHTHIHTQGGGREMHRDSYTHIHAPHKHTHIHTLTHTERQIYTNSYT